RPFTFSIESSPSVGELSPEFCCTDSQTFPPLNTQPRAKSITSRRRYSAPIVWLPSREPSSPIRRTARVPGSITISPKLFTRPAAPAAARDQQRHHETEHGDGPRATARRPRATLPGGLLGGGRRGPLRW